MKLNDKLDRYEPICNLGLNKIPILSEFIKSYPAGGCLGYYYLELPTCRGKIHLHGM